MTPCWDLEPPNVATRLSVKRSKSSGATSTCVVSYCCETATAGAGAAIAASKKLARAMTMTAVEAGKDSRRMDGLLVNDVSESYIRRALTRALADGFAADAAEARERGTSAITPDVLGHASRATQPGGSHPRAPDARRKNSLSRIAPLAQAPSTDWP